MQLLVLLYMVYTQCVSAWWCYNNIPPQNTWILAGTLKHTGQNHKQIMRPQRHGGPIMGTKVEPGALLVLSAGEKDLLLG